MSRDRLCRGDPALRRAGHGRSSTDSTYRSCSTSRRRSGNCRTRNRAHSSGRGSRLSGNTASSAPWPASRRRSRLFERWGTPYRKRSHRWRSRAHSSGRESRPSRSTASWAPLRRNRTRPHWFGRWRIRRRGRSRPHRTHARSSSRGSRPSGSTVSSVPCHPRHTPRCLVQWEAHSGETYTPAGRLPVYPAPRPAPLRHHRRGTASS